MPDIAGRVRFRNSQSADRHTTAAEAAECLERMLGGRAASVVHRRAAFGRRLATRTTPRPGAAPGSTSVTAATSAASSASSALAASAASSSAAASRAQSSPVTASTPGLARTAMSEADPESAVMIVFDGVVTNAARLLAETGGGRRECSARDPETRALLLAYLKWGEDFAGHVEGAFAVAVWDARDASLLLVRDRLGVQPLVYRAGPDGAVFASTAGAILAATPDTAAVDVDGLRELLYFARTPGAGVFRDVSEVAPGTVVRIDPDGVTTRRYWTLAARPHQDSSEDTVGRVRDLLGQSVRRLTGARPPAAAMLSGLDSAAVAALAARAAADRGDDALRTYCAVFGLPGTRAAADPVIHALSAHLGTVHADLPVNVLSLAGAPARAACLEARGVPPLGDFDTSLYLVFQALGRRTGVALAGDGADEVFGGYYWCHEPSDAVAEAFPWTPLTAGCDRFAGLLHPDLAAKLDLAACRAERYREAVAEVPSLPDDTAQARAARRTAYLHLTRFLPIMLERAQRMGAASEVEVLAPFCDVDLVDYVFNIPPEMQTRSGPKHLLRAAVADLLPDVSALTHDHRPAPEGADPAHHALLGGLVRDRLADPACPVAGLLDPAAVAALLAAPAARADRMEPELNLVLGLDTWLRRYGVALDL